MKKAIVLVSGGIDSAVTLYLAKKKYKYAPVVLSFDYGQRARKRELEASRNIARKAGCEYHLLKVSFPWKGSSLLDKQKKVPAASVSTNGRIPNTYVPARNIIFLSYAVSFAEAIRAEAVFIGAHQLDYSNYPDCRSEFFDRFRETIKYGTKNGVEGKEVKIITPLVNKTKKDIISLGGDLNVPFKHTWSCYTGGGTPCRKCESCMFRIQAFSELGIKDPALGRA